MPLDPEQPLVSIVIHPDQSGGRNDTLRGLLESAVEMATECFNGNAKPDDPQPAQIMSVHPNGNIVIFACFFDSPETEIAFREMLPEKLRRDGFRRWVFFTEAWLTDYSGAERNSLQLKPRYRADRREVIIFNAYEPKTGETLRGELEILRPASGPATLSPFREIEPAASTFII